MFYPAIKQVLHALDVGIHTQMVVERQNSSLLSCLLAKGVANCELHQETYFHFRKRIARRWDSSPYYKTIFVPTGKLALLEFVLILALGYFSLTNLPKKDFRPR